jgi:hypothetical protein
MAIVFKHTTLASGQTVNATLPSITAASGVHTLTCYTSNPNSGTDGNATNDQSVSSFTVSITGASLPLVEGFENGTNLPTGWSLSNPDNDAAWEISTSVSHTGTQCIGFNNCNGNGNTDMTGTKDYFYTKSYNMSSGVFALAFDVAYAPCSSGSIIYNDTLIVYASSDCGSTWNQIYRKGGTVLSTAPTFVASSSCWAPSSSQWRTEIVSLASFTGNSNVMLAFENLSGYGSWLYLDNINISTTTGISSANADALEVYPNPAHNNLTVKASQNISSIQIINMLGQVVMSIGQTNELSTEMDINPLPVGVYFVKVTTADTQKLVKVIKQ